MSTDSDERDYEVGRGKPPVGTRFKKGVSGNPRGRPKGALNLGTALRKALSEQVVINEGGRRKTVTKLEAGAKQLANRIASGEPRAMQQLLTVAPMVGLTAEVAPVAVDHTVADQQVLHQMLRRMQQDTQKPTSAPRAPASTQEGETPPAHPDHAD